MLLRKLSSYKYTIPIGLSSCYFRSTPTSYLPTPTMRRGTIIFLVVNLFVIGVLLNAFSTLISLLFEDGSADAIARAEIPAPGSDLIENRTQLIPKIIHQTYINESIPEQWKAGQESCKALHKDYEYKVGLLGIALKSVSESNSRSYGLTRSPASSSSPNTRGSSRPSTITPSLSSVQMRFDTSYLHTMAASTSIWMMVATDASILSSHI